MINDITITDADTETLVLERSQNESDRGAEHRDAPSHEVLNPSHLYGPKPKPDKHRWTEAEQALAEADPKMADLISRVGPCTLEPDCREPYEALVRSVAFQQLHARAAQHILARFHAIYGDYFPPPLMLMMTPEELLRSVGFSKSKIAAIQGIASAAHDGKLPSLSTCRRLDDETLISRLTTLRGVGRWTAEMFLIFTLGRQDVFPVDDFGIREGYRLLHGLEKQPSPAELNQKGQIYAPWRTVASWYLWRATEVLK